MKTLLQAAVLALLVSVASSTVNAQGMQVALLDVGYIFKNHPNFQRQMDAMKNDVKAFEEQLKTQQQQIQEKGKQISSFRPGSPEYKQIEASTTKQLADLKVQAQLKRKEIMENEAKIYLSTYKQVEAAVANYAKQKRIDLVLRYDRDSSSTNSADPRETLKIINRPVIYHGALDISDAILAQFGGVASARQTAPK